MAVQLGIEDFAYFIFCFVENRVGPLELLQEAGCNRVCAQGAYYLECSQVLLCQFPRRSGCVEELHFYIYTVANPEGWRLHPLPSGSVPWPPQAMASVGSAV